MADSFQDLVAEMRRAQKEFFRTKSSTALEKSKRAEREVDMALKEHFDKQPKLFGDDR